MIEHHRKGTTHSDETRQKMRDAIQRRRDSGEYEAIVAKRLAARMGNTEEYQKPKIAGRSSTEISEMWIAFKEGRGPNPFSGK